MNTETLFKWRKLTVSSRLLLLKAHEGALSDSDLNHNSLSFLNRKPMNRRAEGFAGRTPLAGLSNRWILFGKYQISATCPHVLPAGSWSALCARPWVPYKSMIKLSCKKLRHSDTSLPIMKNKLSPSIWKRPGKLYLNLPIMGFVTAWICSGTVVCLLSVQQAEREHSHTESL